MQKSVFAASQLESERLATELKFGDVITLQCIDVLGFVCAAGFDDKRIRVDGLVKGTSIPPNLKDCKFEVLVKRQYAARKALNVELEREKQRRARRRKSDSSAQSLPEGRRRMSSIATRLTADEAEVRSNELDFARSVGSPVRYGVTVQLRHSTSGEFVTVKK